MTKAHLRHRATTKMRTTEVASCRSLCFTKEEDTPQRRFSETRVEKLRRKKWVESAGDISEEGIFCLAGGFEYSSSSEIVKKRPFTSCPAVNTIQKGTDDVPEDEMDRVWNCECGGDPGGVQWRTERSDGSSFGCHA